MTNTAAAATALANIARATDIRPAVGVNNVLTFTADIDGIDALMMAAVAGELDFPLVFSQANSDTRRYSIAL